MNEIQFIQSNATTLKVRQGVQSITLTRKLSKGINIIDGVVFANLGEERLAGTTVTVSLSKTQESVVVWS